MFIVTGSGEFPFDMLRYDECWPFDITDAALMGETNLRSIRLNTNNRHAPNKARWDSFTWKVE